MRITIVALNATPLVRPQWGQAVGGLETFAWRLARSLASRSDVQIQFIVRAPRSEDTCIQDAVRVNFLYEPLRAVRQRVSQSLDFLSTDNSRANNAQATNSTVNNATQVAHSRRRLPRIKQWRASLLWQVPLLIAHKLFGRRYDEAQALRRLLADFAPDVLLTLGVNQCSATLCSIAQQMQIRSVLWFQSNADLDERLFAQRDFIDRYGVSHQHALACLDLCQRFICQTELQRTLLERLVAADHVRLSASTRVSVVPNPIDISTEETNPLNSPTWESRQGVLWIGRADEFHKRPLLARDIARLCPDIQLTMIVNRGDDAVKQSLQRDKPDNVRLIDYVPHAEVTQQMRTSRVFLSTGAAAYEGFPNVLLEAAAARTPIVTLEDFDQFIERSGGGLCANGNVESAAGFLQQLNTDRDAWQRHSDLAIQYVMNHHQTSHITQMFLESL